MFFKRFKYLVLIPAIALFLSSCDDDKVLPVLNLSNSANFVAPSITNTSSTNVGTLNEASFTQIVTSLEWQAADFGVQAPVEYNIEMALESTFANVKQLVSTSALKADFTGEQMNNAFLELGAASETDTTAFLRIVAEVIGAEVDSVVSGTVSITGTPVQLSDCGNFCTVAIIGSATPGGWGVDTDMQLADPTRLDKNTWTTTLFLLGGQQVKFRANDDWPDNWGGAGLTGTGISGGDNIDIPTDGFYTVTFNDNTLEYSIVDANISVFTSVGIIGDATPGGWAEDTDLTEVGAPGSNLWVSTTPITLTAAEAKFRANDAWDVNWGDDEASFPTGAGGLNQGNIPVQEGDFFPLFNAATNEYWFMNEATEYTSIGVVGPFTEWGNLPDLELIKSPVNPYIYSGFITLETDTELKFRADSDWANNWGNPAFPAGSGQKGGANLLGKAGTYFVIFNSGTGEYQFLK